MVGNDDKSLDLFPASVKRRKETVHEKLFSLLESVDFVHEKDRTPYYFLVWNHKTKGRPFLRLSLIR